MKGTRRKEEIAASTAIKYVGHAIDALLDNAWGGEFLNLGSDAAAEPSFELGVVERSTDPVILPQPYAQPGDFTDGAVRSGRTDRHLYRPSVVYQQNRSAGQDHRKVKRVAPAGLQ